MRLIRRLRPRREPVSPMTVVGHGRILHAHLPPARQERLAELAGTATGQWGVLFVVDAQARRWTLYSPDADYTAMFAPIAHTLTVQPEVFAAKFPAWNAEWSVS
jgi:hypothetical protein